MNIYPEKENYPADRALPYVTEYGLQPIEERFPIDTSYGLIQKAGRLFGDDIAVKALITAERDEIPEEITFDSFAKKVTQTANLLHQLGIGRTDAVSILLPSLMENQITLWGSQAAGIVNPINHFLETGHIVDIMNEVKAKVLVTLPSSPSTDLGAKVIKLIKKVPTLEHILLVRKKETEGLSVPGSGDYGIKVLDFHGAIEQQPDHELTHENPLEGKDVAIYFHTGGTTGKPKVAQVTHGGISFVTQLYADHNRHHGRAAVLNPLPLFHVFGVIAGSLAIIHHGRTVVMMSPQGFRNPNVIKNWWFFVEQFQVCWFATVPTILSALLEVPFEDSNIDCLKYISCGSSPLPVALKRACEKKFNVSIANGYGMTESSCLISRSLPGYDLPEDTVGIGIPYTRVITAVVSDNKILEICEPDEPGVILVKGPNIFKGYLNPKENADTWVEDEWFNTGDIGILDQNGYLKITGRAKDLIIRGGHNIDPLIIETALLEHPAVLEVVAIGQPDAYAGEIPVAYICLKSGHQVTESELLYFCKDNIAERSAIPKRLEFIDAIPLTAVGKVSKPVLRNMATEHAVGSVLSGALIHTTIEAVNDLQQGQIVTLDISNPETRATVIELLKGFPITVRFIENS